MLSGALKLPSSGRTEVDDPNLCRKMLELAEAEAAKRGLSQAEKRVARVVIQEGDDEEKAVRAAITEGASEVIVRVIAAPRRNKLQAGLRNLIPKASSSF